MQPAYRLMLQGPKWRTSWFHRNLKLRKTVLFPVSMLVVICHETIRNERKAVSPCSITLYPGILCSCFLASAMASPMEAEMDMAGSWLGSRCLWCAAQLCSRVMGGQEIARPPWLPHPGHTLLQESLPSQSSMYPGWPVISLRKGQWKPHSGNKHNSQPTGCQIRQMEGLILRMNERG